MTEMPVAFVLYRCDVSLIYFTLAATQFPLTSTSLEFTRNLLNLPCEVRDSQDNMRLRYTYLSDGTKSSTSSLPTDSAFRYRYAGKEEQRFGIVNTFDTQLLDFGARYYDPWTCQWTAVDPMAEKYVGSSPTSYCALNPVNIVDLNGMDWYQCDSTGYYTWFDGSDDREGYTYIGGKGALFGNNYQIYIWSTKR